jgi:hypothetical protein
VIEHLVNPARAVEERIFGMEVEVNKLGHRDNTQRRTRRTRRA